MNKHEYWIGKDINYASVWKAYEDGLGYIEKFGSMRVHLLQVELRQYPSHLPLFNHEAVYKTIKGYFHDLKLLILSAGEYDAAGPLFLYSVDRSSGVWNFLGEPRMLLMLAATLAEGIVLGQELHDVDKKLAIIQKYFPDVDARDIRKFIQAKTPKDLRAAVDKLIEQGIERVRVSRLPFEGEFDVTEASLMDIGQLIVKGDLIVGDKIGRDRIQADRGSIAAGSNARITKPKLMQVWHQIAANTDLHELSKELDSLRTRMHKDAHGPEEDVAIGEIAAAQLAAKSGDGPSVLRHMKGAGTWALEFASRVGAHVVAELLKKALSL